jgi:anti-sigma28 factor (negative regulator of flagellin synthesis)
MTHITNETTTTRTNLSRLSPSRTNQSAPPQQSTQESRNVGIDQVQISDAARKLDAQHTGFRSELVDRVRSEIDSGQYDQDARIDQAIDGLIKDLG